MANLVWPLYPKEITYRRLLLTSWVFSERSNFARSKFEPLWDKKIFFWFTSSQRWLHPSKFTFIVLSLSHLSIIWPVHQLLTESLASMYDCSIKSSVISYFFFCFVLLFSLVGIVMLISFWGWLINPKIAKYLKDYFNQVISDPFFLTQQAQSGKSLALYSFIL